MKKIIALFVLMAGVSFTANAQQKKAPKAAAAQAETSANSTIQKSALEDTKTLAEIVGLTTQQMQDFNGLFEWKYKQLAEKLSDERKELVAQTVEAKINASLTSDQITKLNAKPEVLKKLTH